MDGGFSGRYDEAAAGEAPQSITVDATGRFVYVANAGSDDVTSFSIDLASGALTEVGSEVAARSQPSGLERGVLWVKVEHSAWLHELSFMAQTLAEKANEVCGADLVKSVRFHVGTRRSRPDDPLAPTLRI